MPVKFKATERVNPRDLALPRKSYAQIIYGDDLNFDDLIELISKISNLNYGVVMGAIGTLIEVIEMQIRNGRQVHLNTMGSFYLTLASEGTDEPEDLSSSHIRRANLRFRPGKRIRRIIETLEFEKVK